MDETIAAVVDTLSGVRFDHVRDGSHYVDLIIGFVRTHLEVIDAARSSEILDGATLLRKQLESQARLWELQDKPHEELSGKTPQLKHIRSAAARMYGPLSEMAHSSTSRHFQFLGMDKTAGWTSFYPKFTINSFVLANNSSVLLGEFLLWLFGFQERHELIWDTEAKNHLEQCALALHGCMVAIRDAPPWHAESSQTSSS